MKLAHDQHVDWPTLVRELIAQGLTMHVIGKRIGCGQERIRKWVSIECQPRHDDGERLLLLWCDVMRRRREDAPVVSYYASRT